MAYKAINKEWCPMSRSYRVSYVLDSAEDAKDLPKSCPGSTAIVAAKDGPVYMVNASGEWEEL